MHLDSIFGSKTNGYTRGGAEDTRLEAKDIKNPGPRTDFSRTDPLEAKYRNAWANAKEQGDKAQVFSKKNETFKNFFQVISPPQKKQKKVFAKFPRSSWRFPTKF